MASVTMAFPILPGQTEAYRAFLLEMLTGHSEAYLASRQRLGVTAERVWVQSSPAGDVAIMQIEAHDLGKLFTGIATSLDPFDEWFRQQEGLTLDVANGPLPTVLPDLAFEAFIGPDE